MTRYFLFVCTSLFFGSGLALAQDAQSGDGATAGEEMTAPAPAASDERASFECEGSVDEIVTRIEAASTSGQRDIVDACFERFNRRTEALRDSRDTGLAYSEASSELELQLRLIQTMSRQLEPGGRLERNIASLDAEISDLQTQVNLQRDRFPERADALNDKIQELRDTYNDRVQEYLDLRIGVADRMTQLTTFRPIMALEFRADRFAELLNDLEIAIQAAKTAMTGIIDVSEDVRETE